MQTGPPSTSVRESDVESLYLHFTCTNTPVSFCVFLFSHADRWEVVDITGGDATPRQAMRDVEGLVRMLLRALHHGGRFVRPAHDADGEREGEKEEEAVDFVIVENQPCVKNPTMKTLQVALCTYFQTMQMLHPRFVPHVGGVKVVSASSKLGAEWKGLSYGDRKKRAVELAKALLDTVVCPDAVRQRFACCVKKDDMADAFLLAMAFMRNSKTK